MTAVYIAAGILLVILILLLSPIKIRFIIDGGFKVTARWTLIYKQIFPDKEKIKAEKRAAAGKPSNIKKGILEDYVTLLINEKGTKGAFDSILETVKEILVPLKPALPKLRLKIRELQIVVASDDAAKTALEYGAICGSFYNALGRIQGFTEMKKKKIGVYSDFNATKGKIEADITLSAVPLKIPGLLIELIRQYLLINKKVKTEKEGENKNG